MNREEYRKARRLVRDNGTYGLKYVENEVNILTACQYQTYWYCIFKGPIDKLQERKEFRDWCIKQNIRFSPRTFIMKKI
jgi:hypothetical protein